MERGSPEPSTAPHVFIKRRRWVNADLIDAFVMSVDVRGIFVHAGGVPVDALGASVRIRAIPVDAHGALIATFAPRW